MFHSEKELGKYKDKIPADVSADIEKKIEKLKEALKGTETSKIKAAKEELEKHLQRIGEALNAKGAGAHPHAEAHGPHEEQPSQGEGKKSSDDNNIEEAVVEILDDEDKK